MSLYWLLQRTLDTYLGSCASTQWLSKELAKPRRPFRQCLQLSCSRLCSFEFHGWGDLMVGVGVCITAEYSPFYGIEKGAVLQEARIFNDSHIDPRKCQQACLASNLICRSHNPMKICPYHVSHVRYIQTGSGHALHRCTW